MGTPLIQALDITLVFKSKDRDPVTALRDFNLEVGKGEFVSIVGPFAALDAQTRDLMQTELLEIWERTKKTVLFVTHSIEEAAYLSDRVIVMTARPGRAKETLKIQLPRPRDYEMRLTPEFNEIKSRIWDVLKEELTSRAPQ